MTPVSEQELASSDDEPRQSERADDERPPSADESHGTQRFGPQDVEREVSADEGSASDEEQSSERSERDQQQGSASDEEQSSEPDWQHERDPGAQRFGPRDVNDGGSGDEGSASDEEQSSERSERDQVESERDQLIAERDALKELIQRVQADFVNYRKRAAAQSAADVERATGRLAEALLPVLDAAEAAYLRHPDEVGPLLNAMLSELRKHGLEMVDLENQRFDPEIADAVAHEAGDGGDVVVADVLRSGYRWKGTTLRPAMVRTRD